MELLSSINNSGIGAQYAVSAAKDVNGNEITSTYLTAVPEGYATESFVTSQGYITGSYLTADALDNVSSTWNTVTNKLDSTAFSTVSGNFLTAHQSLPNSANWNATYNAVNGNSATWNSTYHTVHDNSASWTGGGGASVTSPRGTINVNGDEIEGTNSAVLTGTAGGYETYLYADNNHIELTPTVLTNDSISVLSQTGGTLVIPVQGSDPSLYITVTGKITGGETATASGQGSAGISNFIYIPLGEMKGPFTAQASYWTNLRTQVLTASAAPTTGVTGVGELAWNSALDSVRNTSAAWNSTYSTVAINSASWAEGTEYSAGSGIDITDDVISLTNPLTLVPSGDVTIDVTGNSAVISVNAGASYTGDAQGALDEVYSNSGTWNTVTDKLNTTAFSTVSGDFLTAHQALPNSGNWDETYTTVSTNSADWNSAAAMNELPVSAGEGMDIQNVDDTIVFSCTGGLVPEGVLVESGLEYNAANEISGYSGSAFAQYGADKQWLQHDDTLLHVANSAQYALGVNVSAVAQLLGEYPISITESGSYTLDSTYVSGTSYLYWYYLSNGMCRLKGQLRPTTAMPTTWHTVQIASNGASALLDGTFIPTVIDFEGWADYLTWFSDGTMKFNCREVSPTAASRLIYVDYLGIPKR